MVTPSQAFDENEAFPPSCVTIAFPTYYTRVALGLKRNSRSSTLIWHVVVSWARLERNTFISVLYCVEVIFCSAFVGGGGVSDQAFRTA